MISNTLEEMTMSSELSEEDRKMLKLLVDSGGRISSHEISEQFGVSISTVQRRRKRLEDTYFIRNYSLDPKKFGYRRIELLINTIGGTTIDIGMELLKREEVTSAFRTLGERAIDLRVEAFVKDNAALLNLIEQVKAMRGVRDVVWTEVIEPVGMKHTPDKASREPKIELPGAELTKNVPQTEEKLLFSLVPTTPVMVSEVPLGPTGRSSEELRILQRIALNGQ
jgi:DNA-binding Lrp family transcriptional regulator